MKKLLFAFAILFSSTTYSQLDTLHPKSTIKDVTVFFSGAQISREAKLNLTAGKHLLFFDRLPEEINPQSVQVNGDDKLQILSVKHQLNYKDQGKKSAKEEAIYDKIEGQKIAMQSVNDELNVLKIEEQLLLDNREIVAGKEGTSVQTLTEVADFYRTRLGKIKKQQLNLQIRLKDQQEELDDLYKELNKIVVFNRQTYSQILVTVDCKRAIQKAISFSYFISSAGWTPLYDFRVKDIASPLSIVYNADVYQSSGEDWKNVNITLSSADPTLSGDKPVLERFYLGQAPQETAQRIIKAPSTLTGRIIDAESGDAVPFANVTLYQSDQEIVGTTTDFDGLYTIKPVPPGYYTQKISFIGYQTQSINGVNLNPNQILTRDIAMTKSSMQLDEVAIQYEKPLFKRRSKYDLDVRNDGASNSVRGSRSGASVTFIDGVKVIGTTGGLSSQYGDLTNDIDLISNAIKQGSTDFEYQIQIPYTILSDGEDYNLKIKEKQIKVDYLYYAVPKLDLDAFLTAQLTDWNKLNLLSGKASIYYEGTFKSETYLDITTAEDTLILSLGRDKGISISRTLDESLTEKKKLGKNVKETVAWKISVRNNKRAPIKLVIEDQYPLSDKDIFDVDLLNSTGAKLDKKEGTLSWELELAPEKKQELGFSYSAEYPKYYSVGR